MTDRNAARGFSLLETLIALVLVGLSMTALLVASSPADSSES